MIEFEELERSDPPSGGAKPVPRPMGPPTIARGGFNKGMLVVVFSIIVIVLMGISLVTPWFIVKTESSNGDYDIEYSFEGGKVIADGDSTTVDWDDQELNQAENTRNLYFGIQIMVIGSLVFGILLLIGAVLAMAGKGPGRNFAIMFGLITLIICLLAPMVFSTFHPVAIEADIDGVKPETGPSKAFIGSDNTQSSDSGLSEMDWGPGIGWILTLLGFIFAVIAFNYTFYLPKTGFLPAPRLSEYPLY